MKVTERPACYERKKKIAVHRAFVLGLGARHRGIVGLSDSEGVIRCVTVFACYSSSSSYERK